MPIPKWFMGRIPVTFWLAVAVATLCAACGKKNDPPPEPDTATTSAASSAHAPKNQKPVGIAECDEYLERYEACLQASGAPAARAFQALKAQRDSFRIAAGTPEGKAGLGARCRAMIDRLAEDKVCAGPRVPGTAGK